MANDATTVATLIAAINNATLEIYSGTNNVINFDIFLFAAGTPKPAAPNQSGQTGSLNPYTWTIPVPTEALPGYQIEVDLTMARLGSPQGGQQMMAWVHVFQGKQVDDGNGNVSAPIPAATGAPYVEKDVLVTFA
jgi:hypothetical protein